MEENKVPEIPADPAAEPSPTPPETGSVIGPAPATPTAQSATDQPAEGPLPQVDSTEPPVKKDFTPPKQKRSKRWLWIIIVLLALAAIGAVGWSLMNKKTTTTLPTNPLNTQQTQSTLPTNNYIPTNVAYAYKGDDHSPYTVYWRLASGGDRTAAEQKLGTSEAISSSDLNGSNVVFATDKAIYASTDAGKSYKSIVTLKDSTTTATVDTITDIKFSTDGKTIVYAFLASGASKNIVKSMDLNGKSNKDLFTVDKAGVRIAGYNSAKQQIVYQEGCWFCDGFNGLPILRDLKSDKVTKLLAGVGSTELGDIAVDADFTHLIYSESTANSAVEGPANTGAAPYTIGVTDLATGKTTKVATFGTKNEKNANGTLKTREVHVGFSQGSTSAYYSNDAQLYVLSYTGIGKAPSLYYTAPKPLVTVEFVGGSKDIAAIHTIIAGYGNGTADYSLVNYQTDTKKSTIIFSGDNNTVIFGVTTK